jgi:hypothetical protein
MPADDADDDFQTLRKLFEMMGDLGKAALPPDQQFSRDDSCSKHRLVSRIASDTP